MRYLYAVYTEITLHIQTRNRLNLVAEIRNAVEKRWESIWQEKEHNACEAIYYSNDNKMMVDCL